jgi:hypothetical protein
MIQAHEVHACEVYIYKMHACGAHTLMKHAYKMYACEVYVYNTRPMRYALIKYILIPCTADISRSLS